LSIGSKGFGRGVILLSLGQNTRLLPASVFVGFTSAFGERVHGTIDSCHEALGPVYGPFIPLKSTTSMT
jgi:hypothetical protein